MTVRQRTVPAPAYRLEDYLVCDGPQCKEKGDLGAFPYSLSHGYGSPFDGDTHEFCSLQCLSEWATSNV